MATGPTLLVRLFVQVTPSSLRNKFVSDPMHGQEMFWMSGILLDLLPQSRDVVVNRAITGALPLRPDGGDQLLARDYDFRPGYEEFQHFELLQRQAQKLIAPAELHLAEIQGDLAETRYFARTIRQQGSHIQHFTRRKITFKTQISAPDPEDLSLSCHKVVKSLYLECGSVSAAASA